MSNLHPCKTCGKEVSPSAKVCPHCGQKLKMGLLAKGCLVGVAGLIAIIALFAFGTSRKANDEAKQVQEEKPIELSAELLASEFKNNEAKANAAYKGKVLQVSGTIEKITEDAVHLKAGNRGELVLGWVHCDFDAMDRGPLANLTNGSTIAIKGLCQGKGAFSIGHLTRCNIVK